jgi:hypothetical protein
MEERVQNKLKVNSYIKFLEGPYAGPLWKIIKVLKFVATNGEEWVRATLDKDTKLPGDEIILEYYPSDARVAYVMTLYNSFPESAQPLPPPIFIDIEEEQMTYKCLDQTATDEDNPGYDAIYQDQEDGYSFSMHHWEYENEAQDRILQVFLQDGFVEIFTGVKLNISNITIF